MRRLIVAAVIAMTCCCVSNAADRIADFVRVPVLDGIYTVEAPADWHLEVSGDDFTATFNEQAGADGTLVIAPPNPVVDDVEEYTTLSVESLLHAFGNGGIVKEDDTNIGKIPTHAVKFGFKVGDNPFFGWVRTVELEGYAVQMLAVCSEKKFDEFMKTAGEIADSYELDVDEADDFLPELKRVGRRAYDEMERNLKKEPGAAMLKTKDGLGKKDEKAGSE